MRRSGDRPVLETGGTVLVVDADPTSRLASELQAQLDGYVVAAAFDVASGLRAAEERQPPLVLVRDRAALPTRRLCTRLRADWRYGNPLLFVLTGDPRRATSLAGFVDECLPPTDPEALAQRIDRALQRAAAMRDASPLTGLPGNAAITAELQRRLASGGDVALLYVDLDNFKAVNDHYGFLRGDEMIVGLAGVLRSVMADAPGLFVGHVGGDDFIMLAPRDDAEAIGPRILRGFDAIVADYYDVEDLARGGLTVRDRRGHRRTYPLASLSIGIASASGPDADHRALVATATDMKAEAKRSAGSTIAVDRRSGSSRPPAWPRRVGGWVAGPFRYWDRRATRRLAAAAMVSLLFVGVVGLSGSATPGDRLYPTKLFVEEVRLLMARSPAAELQLRLELSSRRAQELMTLVSEEGDPELLDRAGKELRRHLAALEAGASRGGPEVEALKDRIEGVLAQQMAVLDAILARECGADVPSRPIACAELELARAAAVRNLMLVRGQDPSVTLDPDEPVAEETVPAAPRIRRGGSGLVVEGPDQVERRLRAPGASLPSPQTTPEPPAGGDEQQPAGAPTGEQDGSSAPRADAPAASQPAGEAASKPVPQQPSAGVPPAEPTVPPADDREAGEPTQPAPQPPTSEPESERASPPRPGPRRRVEPEPAKERPAPRGRPARPAPGRPVQPAAP